jgi:hypothetical protein
MAPPAQTDPVRGLAGCGGHRRGAGPPGFGCCFRARRARPGTSDCRRARKSASDRADTVGDAVVLYPKCATSVSGKKASEPFSLTGHGSALLGTHHRTVWSGLRYRVATRLAAARPRSLRLVTTSERRPPPPWNGSWNGASADPSAATAVSAMSCAICAASVLGARGRTSCKRQVSGSIPLTGSQVRGGKHPLRVSVRGTNVIGRGCLAALRLSYGRWRLGRSCGSGFSAAPRRSGRPGCPMR